MFQDWIIVIIVARKIVHDFVPQHLKNLSQNSCISFTLLNEEPEHLPISHRLIILFRHLHNSSSFNISTKLHGLIINDVNYGVSFIICNNILGVFIAKCDTIHKFCKLEKLTIFFENSRCGSPNPLNKCI